MKSHLSIKEGNQFKTKQKNNQRSQYMHVHDLRKRGAFSLECLELDGYLVYDID